jgi:ADP-L-glycero-D-manno-heptose 6-epimerase
VNLWLLDHGAVSGIFNVGTGRSATFNELAHAVIRWHGRGEIRYIPFPEALRPRYQSFTEADIGALRAAGYERELAGVEAGVPAYLDALGPEA